MFYQTPLLKKGVAMCPYCQNITNIYKRGFYHRKSDQLKIQRYECGECGKGFSSQTSSFDYRLRKRRINQSVFRLLSKGMSQNACAQVLQVDPKTIARRVILFGKCAKKHIQNDKGLVHEIAFDEMESFEHTKLKPLTIPVAIENKTRKILHIGVGQIAAKGHLANISRKKYGYRQCQRKIELNKMFRKIKPITNSEALFYSDESHHYPKALRKYFKDATHKTFKGRRAAIIGQGEMKKGGYDPLFFFNQTAAMIRDNIKRLARRTWCTTKIKERLLDLLHIYAFYHNQRIEGVKRPSIYNCSISN